MASPSAKTASTSAQAYWNSCRLKAWKKPQRKIHRQKRKAICRKKRSPTNSVQSPGQKNKPQTKIEGSKMTTSIKPGKKPIQKAEGENTILLLIRQGGSKFLAKLRQRSIRSNNSWYRVLSLDKRRFIDAVIQTVNKIRSSLLIKILTGFVEKLLQAMGGIRGLTGTLVYQMQNFGYPLVQKISTIAANWGNKLAAAWSNDEGFIRYLSVIDMNNLPIFRVIKKQ